jgi:hypothetical protein
MGKPKKIRTRCAIRYVDSTIPAGTVLIARQSSEGPPDFRRATAIQARRSRKRVASVVWDGRWRWIDWPEDCEVLPDE